MKILRKLLGILVMIAGILGLILSLAGLVSIWMAKPAITNGVTTTVSTLSTSIDTSQNAMKIAGETLSSAVVTVDALSEMLATTATTVVDTQPVMTQLNSVIGETLPATLESAAQSLLTAQQAAVVLDSAIKSLETFQMLLSATPFLGSMVQPAQAYNPEVPLADSLGALAETLKALPDTFSAMSDDIDKADNNLVSIETSLTTMSVSIGQISKNLADYETMITQSNASMDSLKGILSNVQNNLANILNGVVLVASLFLVWMLAAQIVILSQGWELFQGTAGQMNSGKVKTIEAKPSSNQTAPVEPSPPDAPTEENKPS